MLVLANLESYNAVLIKQGKSRKERMQLLCELVIQQIQTLNVMNISGLPDIKKVKTRSEEVIL